MEKDKKLGRGLEDFSHLFLSPCGEEEISPEDKLKETHSLNENYPPFNFCITSYANVQEQAFITLNIALELSNLGKNVLILDADYRMPRICMLVDIINNGSVLDFLSGNLVIENPPQISEGVKLLTIDADITDLSSVGIKKRLILKKYIKKAEDNADIILISTPSSFNNPLTKKLFSPCDEIMITVPNQLKGMMSSYALIKRMCKELGNVSVGLIPIKISIPEQQIKIMEKMEKMAGKFLNKSLMNYGFVPDDTELFRSISRREPASISKTSTRLSESLSIISESVLKIYEQKHKDISRRNSYSSLAEELFNINGKFVY